MLAELAIGIVALVLLVVGLHQERRLRLIRDVPTVSPAGVFIGLVETTGMVRCEEPLIAGLTDQPCVWNTWSVQESWSRLVTRTVTDSKGNSHTETYRESGWATIASGGECIPFELADDEGAVRVRPDGADIRADTSLDITCGRNDPLYYDKGPRAAISSSDYLRRFHEDIIPPGANAWIIGQARLTEDGDAAELAKDPHAPLFVISLAGEKQVESGYWWRSLLPKLFGLVIAGVAGAIIGQNDLIQFGNYEIPIVPIAIACGIFMFCWVIGWIWLVHNSLIELRQRVRQAWSNIDVQVKRRHDLIGELLPTVQALAGHEHRVQEDVAALRAQLVVTPPGEPGSDVTRIAPRITALAEAYPDLIAQDGFKRLHKAITDCENCIALSRGWFNDISTNWNTRLERIPDRWVAQLADMRPQSLLQL